MLTLMGSKSAFSGISHTTELVLLVALDGDFVLEARHDDLPVAHFRRAMHGHEIAIENAGILHRHADDLEQVVRPGLKDGWIDVEPRFDIFFGENGTCRRRPGR